MTNPEYDSRTFKQAEGRLVEELGELQAAMGKSLRWGYDSYNPEIPEDERESNADWVRREMKDVEEAIAKFRWYLDINGY